MIKEEVFELIKEGIKELLHTNIIMYPAGSMQKEEAAKIGATCEYYYLDDNKPEFADIQGYRKSLLELISKLIDFYKEV